MSSLLQRGLNSEFVACFVSNGFYVIWGADVEEGGETSFSQSHWLNETAQRHSQPSECARNRVFVKPSKVGATAIT